MTQQFYFWVYNQRKWNQYLEEMAALSLSLQHYSVLEGNPAICDNRMNLGDIMLHEKSQMQKDKYWMMSKSNISCS